MSTITRNKSINYGPNEDLLSSIDGNTLAWMYEHQFEENYNNVTSEDGNVIL